MPYMVYPALSILRTKEISSTYQYFPLFQVQELWPSSSFSESSAQRIKYSKHYTKWLCQKFQDAMASTFYTTSLTLTTDERLSTHHSFCYSKYMPSHQCLWLTFWQAVQEGHFKVTIECQVPCWGHVVWQGPNVIPSLFSSIPECSEWCIRFTQH